MYGDLPGVFIDIPKVFSDITRSILGFPQVFGSFHKCLGVSLSFEKWSPFSGTFSWPKKNIERAKGSHRIFFRSDFLEGWILEVGRKKK